MSGSADKFKPSSNRYSNPKPNPYFQESTQNPWESSKPLPAYTPKYQFSTLNSMPVRHSQSNSALNEAQNSWNASKLSQLSLTSPQNKMRSQEIKNQLENELKRLDEDFTFDYDEEISLIQSAKYIRQAVDKIIFEKQQVIEQGKRLSQTRSIGIVGETGRSGSLAIDELKSSLENQNFQASQELEKIKKTQHQLKRYESILRQKEKNLKDQETHVNYEKSEIEKEKAEVLQEREKLAFEKEENQKTLTVINEEKQKLSAQMNSLDNKFLEIKAALGELEKEPKIQGKDSLEDFEQQRLEFLMECEEKAEWIAKAEESLNLKEKILAEQQEELNQLSQSLQQLKDEMESQQEAISSHLESQTKSITTESKQLEGKKKEIESTLKMLNEKLKTVEALEKGLEEQKKIRENEEQKLKEHYIIKLDEAIKMNQEAQENMKLLAEKEAFIDDIIQKIKEEENELENRWKYLEDVEGMKEELEKVRMMYEEASNELKKRDEKQQELIKDIQEREDKVLLRENQGNNENTQPNEKIEELYNSLEEKLQFILQKESELQKMQEYIEKDREDIDRTADLLQKIHSELSEQRELQGLEQEKMKLDKQKILDMFEKLNEESLNIRAKEEELLEKEEFLNSKEVELLEKESEIVKKNHGEIDEEKPEDDIKNASQPEES